MAHVSWVDLLYGLVSVDMPSWGNGMGVDMVVAIIVYTMAQRSCAACRARTQRFPARKRSRWRLKVQNYCTRGRPQFYEGCLYLETPMYLFFGYDLFSYWVL